MNTLPDVLRVIDQTLHLQGRALQFTADTPLLGELPELDSMAVLSLLTGLEEHFGIGIRDEDISGETFATVGSVCALVDRSQAPAAR